MSTINQSIDRVRELLLGPFEQRPSLKQTFGAVLREYQNFYNEFNNSGVPWSYEEFSITSGAGPSYLVTGAKNAGKVLFVTAQTTSTNPYPVEFTELADVSVNLAWYQPLTAARPEDYNGWGYNPLTIAFYRKSGDLYARLPVNYPSGTELTVTCATGNWTDGVDIELSGVMSSHHHLPEIRAARNLLPGAQWTDNVEADEIKRRNLAISLTDQEMRAQDNLREAKRNMTVDTVTFRTSCDDDW